MLPPDPGISNGFSSFLRFIETGLSWILSPDLQAQLFPLKFVFIIFGIGFLAMIVYFSATTTYFDWWFLGFMRNFLFPKILRKRSLSKKWRQIKKYLDNNAEEQWKLAIIEAAELLDKTLRNIGYDENGLERKLSKIDKEEIGNIEELKKAQQVIYSIANEPQYRITKSEAEKIIGIIQQSLKDLASV